MPPDTGATTLPATFDLARHYVRVRGRSEAGLVEFDFSIGDPRLSVELLMTEAVYREFCERHRVIRLSAAQGAELDIEEFKWRYGMPGVVE